MKAVFLSDAHIRDHRDPNLPPLLDFLDTLPGRIDRLYIVGDFFDTWFAFSRTIYTVYAPLLGALYRVRRAGARITYLAGNHDYELGSFFTDVLEADVHQDGLEISEDGHRAYVAHGDMADPKDWSYRFLRGFLRSALARGLGRNLPPWMIWRIAQFMTHGFSGDESAQRERFRPMYDAFSAGKFAEGYDVVILGHLHIPTFEERGGKTYVNLGDWVTARTWLEWTDGRLALKTWGTTAKE